MAPRLQPINSTGKPCNKRANALMIGDSHKRGSTKIRGQSPPNKAVQFTVCDDIYPTSLSPGLVDLVIEHGHADVLFDTQ